MESILRKATRVLTVFILAFAMVSVRPAVSGSLPPLSEDDVLLLLMGSAPSERKAEVIAMRGIDTNWGADFRKRLGTLCMDEGVRSALQHEFDAHPPQTALPQSSGGGAGAFDGVVTGTVSCAGRPLAAPDSRLVSRIVERLTNNDLRLEALLKNYTYRQSLLAEQLDPSSGQVLGTYCREWDVMLNDRGKRVFHETAVSGDTLGSRNIHLLKATKAQGIQPLTFLPDDRPDYSFTYVGHVTLDQISAYQLAVEPTKSGDGNHYFKGTIWVEDRTLQIVKTEGDTVPSFEQGPFGWRFYPHYLTFRSHVSGPLWFPALAVSEGTANGIRLKTVTKYFEYRRFGSSSLLIPDLSEYQGDDDPQPTRTREN